MERTGLFSVAFYERSAAANEKLKAAGVDASISEVLEVADLLMADDAIDEYKQAEQLLDDFIQNYNSPPSWNSQQELNKKLLQEAHLRYPRVDYLQQMLAAGADMYTGQGITAWHKVCMGFNEEAKVAFLQNGADPNRWSDVRGCTAGFEAMKSPSTDLLIALMDQDYDATISSDYNEHLYHITATHRDNTLLWMMLIEKPDPNQKNGGGNTPLMVGCENNISGGAIEYLLKKGNVDPAYHMQADSKETLLHKCARRRNAEGTQVLLAHGWDPNAQDEDGKTPLHYTMERYLADTNDAVIEALIAGGANPNLNDNQGHTAYRTAIDNGYESAASIMKSAEQANHDAGRSNAANELNYLKEQIVAQIKEGKMYTYTDKEALHEVMFQKGWDDSDQGFFGYRYFEHNTNNSSFLELEPDEVIDKIRGLRSFVGSEVDIYQEILENLKA